MKALFRKILSFLPLLFLPTVALAASGTADASGLLNTIFPIVIVALIFWAIWWFIGYVGVPEPFNKVIRVLIGLVALVYVVNLLLGMTGSGPVFHFR